MPQFTGRSKPPLVLELDLTHPLIEQEPDDPIAKLRSRGKPRLRPILRGALDKIGVDPQLDKRYEYKNAADRITQTSFTDAHREAADRLTESAWEQVVDAVATARDVTADEVQSAADQAPLFAEQARNAGLIDRIGYRDEVYTSVRRAVGGDVQLLYADRWSPATTPVRRLTKKIQQRSAPGLALVEGYGGIVTGRSRRTPLQGNVMGSDTVAAAIRAAVRDEKVRGIVFRVDSPGGSYVASDTVWREVACARDAGKPVIVSMGTVAGSGGYFVACNADVIVAQPGTLTGSIGVFGGKPVTTELTDKFGLAYDAVQRGANARMFSTHVAFTDAQRERLNAWLDAVYGDFTAKVAAGRGMSKDAVHEIAKGRVWTGADGLRIGLVDSLGGMRHAVSVARERAGLPADAPLRPAVSVPPLARLKPPRSSEDPRAAAAAATSLASLWAGGWGEFAALAAALGLPAAGPLTMPAVRLG
jgi:protease-4